MGAGSYVGVSDTTAMTYYRITVRTVQTHQVDLAIAQAAQSFTKECGHGTIVGVNEVINNEGEDIRVIFMVESPVPIGLDSIRNVEKVREGF